MRWARRTIVIGALAAAVATGLAVALVVVLSGRGTGQVMTFARGQVWVVFAAAQAAAAR